MEEANVERKKGKFRDLFAYMRCPSCNREFGQRVKSYANEISCKSPSCKGHMSLDGLTRVYGACECGYYVKGCFTNIQDGMFDIPCPRCGQPITMVYDHKKRAYKSVYSSKKGR